MATVSHEQCGECDSLLLKHDSGVYACPECNAQYFKTLMRITSAGNR